jgi:hypothetical protein
MTPLGGGNRITEKNSLFSSDSSKIFVNLLKKKNYPSYYF